MIIFKSLDELSSYKTAYVTIGSFDGLHLGHQEILKNMIKDSEHGVLD